MSNTNSTADNVLLVAISDIIVPRRHRALNASKASMLEASIEEIGLLSPIVITEEYALVAGRHRLAAFENMGKTEIPCIVMTYDDIDAELAEIDENLVRYELEVMDRALHISRRKKLYELKYPHTKEKYKTDKLNALLENVSDLEKSPELVANELGRPSFVVDTAEKTGKSTTVIRDEALLGEKIEENLSDEVIDLLRPTKVAGNKRELNRLIDEHDEDAQLEIAKKIRKAHESGAAIGVSEASNELHGLSSYSSNADTSGEKPILTSMTKVERILSSTVEGKDFERILAMWTEDGLMDMRDQLYAIERLAQKGITIISKLIDE